MQNRCGTGDCRFFGRADVHFILFGKGTAYGCRNSADSDRHLPYAFVKGALHNESRYRKKSKGFRGNSPADVRD